MTNGHASAITRSFHSVPSSAADRSVAGCGNTAGKLVGNSNTAAHFTQALQMSHIAGDYLMRRGASEMEIHRMVQDGSLIAAAGEAMKEDRKYLAEQGFTQQDITMLGMDTGAVRFSYDESETAAQFMKEYNRQLADGFDPSADYESIDEAVTEDARPSLMSRIANSKWTKVAMVAGAVGIGAYAFGGDVDKAGADVITTQTELNASSGGINVSSQTYLDTDNGWRVFDYLLTNNSGDTIYQAKFFGQDWVGGGGVNQTWSTDIQASVPADPLEDFINFSGNLLDDGSNEEYITGSSLTDKWGIGAAEFKTVEGNTFNVDVLKPTTVPEPYTLAMLVFGAGLILTTRRRANTRTS